LAALARAVGSWCDRRARWLLDPRWVPAPRHGRRAAGDGRRGYNRPHSWDREPACRAGGRVPLSASALLRRRRRSRSSRWMATRRADLCPSGAFHGSSVGGRLRTHMPPTARTGARSVTSFFTGSSAPSARPGRDPALRAALARRPRAPRPQPRGTESNEGARLHRDERLGAITRPWSAAAGPLTAEPPTRSSIVCTAPADVKGAMRRSAMASGHP
jgi:hypothetical protein